MNAMQLAIYNSAGERSIVLCRAQGKVPVGKFELVFTTAMSGYVESCTDPSYAMQALAFAHPIVGSHGIPRSAFQSKRLQPALVIVRAPTEEFCAYVCERGGCIIQCDNIHVLVENARCGARVAIVDHEGPDVIPRAEPALAPSPHLGDDILLVDFGCKLSLLYALQDRKKHVSIVHPSHAKLAIESVKWSGIVLSNGAGDPRHDDVGIQIAKAAVHSKTLTLGVCYGHQLLGIAAGGELITLPCGHRGVNHPIMDVRTGQISITSHNHGYAFTQAPPNAKITHVSLLDGSVEGLEWDAIRSVQFHPEGAPGPRLDEVIDSFTEATMRARRST